MRSRSKGSEVNTIETFRKIDGTSEAFLRPTPPPHLQVKVSLTLFNVTWRTAEKRGNMKGYENQKLKFKKKLLIQVSL